MMYFEANRDGVRDEDVLASIMTVEVLVSFLMFVADKRN